VIDIKGVKELHELSYNESNGLSAGAAVTRNQLLDFDALPKNLSVLCEAVSTIGDYEIRNRATLVGNIANASPAADSAPALLVLDAQVNIKSKR